MNRGRLRAPGRWELALIAVTALWGATFTIIRDTVQRMPPFLYISLRFGLAAAVLAATGALRGARRSDIRAGVIVGIPLFAGYALQITGQQYTTPSNAGFITGLFVVFTPLIGGLWYRRAPSRVTLAGVTLATAGLVLLALRPHLAVAKGDMLILGTAIAFAVHILTIARYAPGRSVAMLTCVQASTAAVIAVAWTAIAERQPPPGAEPFLWFAIALTGIFATAVGFMVQVRAQQESPPTRTAVILTAEPVFAGIFGYALAGDRLGARGYIGAVMIVVGIVVTELLAPERERV